jgi:arylsulfatase A-like enzyme
VKTLARLGLLGLAILACGGTSDPAGRPNLLLVCIDTLRADMIGAYGYPRPTTPTLDRLAAQGVLFEDALATSPWTLPSGASLLTGLYPHRHGMKSAERSLARDVATWAALLQRRGYATAAVVNAHWMSARYGFDRGFDSFRFVRPAQHRDRPGAVVDEALAWLDAYGAGPFFLFVHDYHVHSDYDPLPEYAAIFARPYRGVVDGTTEQLKAVRAGQLALDERDVEHLVDLYVAGIRHVDGELSRLLERLERDGRLEDTLVIVTADHGEEFLEHGGVLHGRTQYQEVLRVPLILRGPGVPVGRRVAEPVSLVDVLPTALALLGEPAPDGIDGVDLAPLWRDAGTDAERLRDRLLFGEADHNNESPDATRAVRRGRFKLIADRPSGRAVLFDLEADPGETRDVSERHPEIAGALRTALEASGGESAQGPELTGLSPEEEQRLRALGYLEP